MRFCLVQDLNGFCIMDNLTFFVKCIEIFMLRLLVFNGLIIHFVCNLVQNFKSLAIRF